MNKELEEIIMKYSTRNHKELVNSLLDKSKDNIISILIDLLTLYINDKNSSTLRELITVILSGYKHSKKKIGFNGFRQTSIEKTLFCEAKPKNFDTEEIEKYEKGERKSLPAKLCGYGNFSDYTHARLKRDEKENLSMLVSGFVDGKLIYIIEFPFNLKSFVLKLKKQLNKNLPNGDEKNKFLRSANFDYRDYVKPNGIKFNFLLERNQLKNFENCIAKNFFKFLIKNSK